MKSRSNDALLRDARRVEIFNSGLEVWLYDRASREELKASGAFEETADDATFEAAMQSFVREGRLMVYQLAEDNGVDVAVSVRKPFTKRELAAASWLAPQQAFLRLPTGRLVIESNDSLTIRTSTPTDPGAEIAVPPGDYLATLHRIDCDAFDDEEGSADERWSGPSEIITLTAGARAKPLQGQPAILPWQPNGPGSVQWRIENGSYEGAVVFHDDELAMSIALDPAGISQLGLRDKSIALLSVPGLEFECVLVWVAGDKTKGAYYDRLEQLRPPAALGGREWAHCGLDLERDAEAVVCLRRLCRFKVPKKQQETWHPATLKVLEGQALEKRSTRT